MKRSICAVFDIDDTLYLESDYVRSGFNEVGRWVAKWLQIGDFAERCWSSFQTGRRGTVFDEALRDSGREPSKELVSALVEIYRTHVPCISLAEDAVEALMSLSTMVSIAVISDGPAASQSQKSDALGLGSFADPIVFTSILGSGYCKPHRRAFEIVSQCRPASHYLYIADNPLKDFSAPRQLGWTTLRVRRPGGLHFEKDSSGVHPDHEMPDCSRLPDLLSQL